MRKLENSMETKYYSGKTDEEIEAMIGNLTPFQRKKFEVSMINFENQRQALFVSSSYPLDIEEKENGINKRPDTGP